MSAEKYLEAIRPYQLENGIVTLTDPPAQTDNPFLFHAQHVFILKRLHAYPRDIAKAEFDFARYLQVRKKASPVWLPLPESPWGHKNISHDEINGLAAMGYGEWIYNHAHPTWIFNTTGNLGDYFRGWYGRFAYLIPFIRVMAGKPVSQPMQLAYAWELERASKSSWQEPHIDTGKRCLLVLQSQWIDLFPQRMQEAMAKFLSRTESQFVDLGGLYQYYFQNHPMGTFTKGIPLIQEEIKALT